MSYWSAPEPRRAHLLVVDDNVDELKLLLETLRGTGYRITLAFDAMEGYRRATTLQMDLVLLDVRLGRTDGFSVCRLLKANPTTADIPVIFVSSSASLEERLTGLRAGAVDYIVKPFDPAEVMARIEIHLALAESRRARTAAGTRPAPPPDRPAANDGGAAGAGMDHALLQAAERLILADLSHVPPLRELAARVGTHEKRLSRVFKELADRTVFEFVREARLHEAQRLLLESAMRIEEIAAAVGFSSAANFATAFREYFDCTPSACRQAGAGRSGT
ncbi:AraC family two component transcriptional regulator [Variovorax beijingensis]|uniref:AraC family two component transcriptional regulator n=1 Tax=Variovorax beijingensis TaxID=2496117 RepID=A0A561BBQ1_9BURK|nr:DNA-binding response regulator [Variovorax beijingensis]TWD76142.1 AraC family two component transcriptional regulator [Variovorax beijingensis]